MGEVRGIGLFAGLDLVKDPQANTPRTPFNTTAPVMDALRSRLLELGVLVYLHWNVVLIVPPLII